MRRSRLVVGHSALALALLGAACGPSARVAAPSATPLMTAMLGSWTLVQGCGGISYHCTPADSLPAPDRLVFFSDGTIEHYRRGVRVAIGTYVITPSASDSLRAGSARLSPGLEGASETLSLAFSIEGQLMLAEPCCDRLTYTFQKQVGLD